MENDEKEKKKQKMLEKGIVPDTSALINGQVASLIKRRKLTGINVYIPEAVISELEALANRGLSTGHKGLTELKKLNKMEKEGIVKIHRIGKRPTLDQIKLAKSGVVDALIRDVALEKDAVLITADKVQGEVAEACGIEVEYTFRRVGKKKLTIENFFTPDTTSVHLKSNWYPLAKRGPIGDQRLEKIMDKKLSDKELEEIIRELYARVNRDPKAFLEIDYPEAKVFQIGDMRIAVAKPPFSDATEITAVRPTAIVDIDSYRFADELKRRVVEKQRGILVAGPPGAGKSAFAASIARFLTQRGFIVKTMESPRDLQVGDEITQYSKLNGNMTNTAELLLLVRPDYTIYDEVRKTSDFMTFADMRLSGVGMVGVVHANRPIDAIQRLIGRIDLGMITQVVDTVVFIDKGEVKKVYDLRFTVKVPHGMFQEDLARPVIIVEDFETKRPEYEIYTYGEQTVVMPIEKEAKMPEAKLAADTVKRSLSRYVSDGIDVEIVGGRALVYASKKDIPKIIGRGGKRIEKIEGKLGIPIQVLEKTGESREGGEGIGEIYVTKKSLVIKLPEYAGEDVDIYVGGTYLFTATVSKNGEVKISRASEFARIIENALESGESITIE